MRVKNEIKKCLYIEANNYKRARPQWKPILKTSSFTRGLKGMSIKVEKTHPSIKDLGLDSDTHTISIKDCYLGRAVYLINDKRIDTEWIGADSARECNFMLNGNIPKEWHCDLEF